MAVIALAGGGTGGHVYPALAIGEVLQSRGHTVVMYGDPGRLEGRVAPSRGVALRSVGAVPFPRGGGIGARVRFAWALLVAVLGARRQLRRDRVAAVLGVGGYIAAPTVLAARTLGIPVVIHEANAVPGLANRLCARVAQRVLVVFDATRAHLPDPAGAIRVGMPVSASVAQGSRAEAARRYGLDPACPTVLVVGGSLGASALNDLAIAMGQIAGDAAQILHLCGPRFEGEVRARLPDSLPRGYVLVPYEDRMADAYAVADLVVCRSGSGTLAELALVGVAAVLVPSPHVTDDHQAANARALEQAGAARMVREEGWALPEVVSEVVALLGDPAARAEMAAAMKAQARPQAAADAADAVLGALAG